MSRALYAGDDRLRGPDVLWRSSPRPGSPSSGSPLAVPVLVWLARRQAWRTAVWVVVAAVFVRHVTSALKDYFDRVRPPFEDGGAATTR